MSTMAAKPLLVSPQMPLLALLEEGSPSLLLVSNALVLLFLFSLLLYQLLNRRATRETLQEIAQEELAIVQEASMDVSLQLFPLDSLFSTNINETSNEDEKDAWSRNIEQILSRIQTPTYRSGGVVTVISSSHPSSPLLQIYHKEQLWVLGGAIWCRFQFYGRATSEALSELAQILSTNDLLPPCVNSSSGRSRGLPFMNDVIQWAILPQDREIMGVCLEVLAWIMKSDPDFEDPTTTMISALPEEVLTMLTEEVVCSYLKQKRLNNKDEPEPEPQLVPTREDGNTCCDETAPLLFKESISNGASTSTTSRHEKAQQSRAAKVCGYLHFLNVFTTVLSRDGGETTDTDDHNDDELSYFKLRPGVLKPCTAPSALCSAWIPAFLKRLEEESGVHNSCLEKEANSSENIKGQAPLRAYVLGQLPTVMIHLCRLPQAIELLHNRNFATSRLQHFGLSFTVIHYIKEWDLLQEALRISLLLPENSKPASTSPVFVWLCVQSLSQASEITLPSHITKGNDKHQQANRKDVATACYTLAQFAMARHPIYNNCNKEPLTPETVQLLHHARHLQLLVLEGQSRRVAKAIHNLALTLHVRETFPKEKKRSAATSSDSSSEQPLLTATPPSQKCFEMSADLSSAVAKMYQDNKDNIDDTTLEKMVLVLCQELLRVWFDFQPTFAQAKLETEKESTAAIPSHQARGIQFRIDHVIHQFQTTTREFRFFANTQVALCELPCTAETVRRSRRLFDAQQKLSNAIKSHSRDKQQKHIAY